MSLDDVIKSFALFNQGVQQYKISQATNEANDKLQALQANEDMKKDINGRLQAQTNIANELALKMSGAGASAADVQAATGRIGVSAGEQLTMGVVPATQLQSEKTARENLLLQFQQQKDLLEKKMELLTGVSKKKELAKVMGGIQKEFGSQADVTEITKSLPKLETLQTVIDQGGNIGPEIAKISVIRDASGNRVNRQELEAAKNDPSWRKNLARRFNLELTGDALASDKLFWSNLGKAMLETNKAYLSKRINGWAKGKAKATGADENTISEALHNSYNLEYSGPSTPGKADATSENAQKAMWSDFFSSPGE